MAVTAKKKLSLKKKKTAVSLKKISAGKAKKTQKKMPAKPAKASKTKKPAHKKVTTRTKARKSRASARISLKVKKTVKAKSRVAAVKKISKKKILKDKSPKSIEKKLARLHSLKKTLIEKRESILKEAKEEIAKYISGENRQLVDTALDDGDWAVVDTSEDLNLMRLTAHRRTLLEIDEALRKIKDGTYGICEECGEEISEKRLSILPAATLCINCKEDSERLEAIEKAELA